MGDFSVRPGQDRQAVSRARPASSGSAHFPSSTIGGYVSDDA